MVIVLLGMPGCGKGTQAELLTKYYNIPHISTGDLFRKEMANKTELGVLAQSYINNGHFVPDEVSINMLKNRVSMEDCKNGYILDGFPRTLPQADALNSFANVDVAILLDIDEEEVRERAMSRRTCDKCGAIYNIHNYASETCELCGGNLYIREDAYKTDERIKTYNSEALPLVDYYKAKGVLKVVDQREYKNCDVEKQIKNIFNHIVNIIGENND